MKRPVIAILASLLAASATLGAHAAWPERPITFVVPYAAGGLNDNEARITARWLTKALKQNVLVENRLGASGAIAADYVARARPDGYTFFFTALPTMVMVPHTQKVNYDPFKNFVPIATMDASYMAFAVNPDILPAKTFSELVTYAKARPNEVSYATGGTGVTGHLSMVILLNQARLEMTHVPYKGSSEAVVAVLGGHAPLYVGTLSDVLEHHKRGKLKIIGVSSAKRLSELPDIPTIAEQGYPSYKIVTWNGLLATAGTPKDVISTIAESLKAACQDAAFNAAFQALGVEPACSTPEQFAERLRADWTMWGEAVKASGVAQQ
jgi:tripartite-type tricarboxylate transporter receptor subunit TctC